jgi:UDP-glucose 4-epimerase
MRILVTGGAGFIGSHLTDALLAQGHAVSVFDDLSTGSRKNVPQGAVFTQGDLRNPEGLDQIFTGKSFEVVFHLAAQIDVRKSVADPAGDAETNILGSLRLIDCAAKSGTRTFIFSSTGGAIYGDTEVRPTPESHPENPLSPYGIAKLAIDKYLAFYGATTDMRAVSLRYGNVYGPRQNPHGEAGVVAIFSKMMLEGRNPVINGDGTQTRDYVFVGDVVRANLAALEASHASGVYNIGTAQETSVNELFAKLNALSGGTFKEEYGEAKRGEQKTSSLDASRAARELGWRPETDLTAGLQATWEWFSETRNEEQEP